MDNKPQITYIKLGELVNSQFKVEKIFPSRYKAWDNDARKMLMSDTPQQGYQKKYTVDSDKGRLDMSQSQIAQMLEGVTEDGRADINGRSFKVKSNGKTGMEIRYFINPVPEYEAHNEGFDQIEEVELPSGW